MAAADRGDEEPIARGLRGRAAPLAIGAVAVVYLSAIWIEAVDAGSAARRLSLPAPIAYFTQIAGLFERAARHALDHRVEGYACGEGKWVEIDVSPSFPIEAENKENRLYRALHFYSEHRPTMRALDKFVVDRHNDRSAQKIGGVRFVRLRLPLPEPGAPVPRFSRRPLETYPEEARKNLYWTPESTRITRCAWFTP
jgi:hypothetical protein